MSIKRHKLGHTGKFRCTFDGCIKGFEENCKLRRHILTHTGEKPFTCEFCKKTFALDFNMRTHMRVHTGEKNYMCSFPGCLQRFSQSSNMTTHEKGHYN